MTKKLKLKLLILLAIAAAAALSLFAGCKLGLSLEDVLQNNDLTAHVKYYANGGVFENYSDTKDIYYKANSRIVEITETSNFKSGTASVKREKYQFVGWYYVTYDGEGNILYADESKTTMAGDEEVDFSSLIVKEGDEIEIFAKWLANVKVNVIMKTEQSIEYYGTTYEDGCVLRNYTFDSTGLVQRPDLSRAPLFGKDLTEDTFVHYYADEACTQLVEWPIRESEAGEQDVDIYAKFIAGSWTVLRSASDVQLNWSNFASAGRFYLSNDIDCSGATLAALSQFNCQLKGNGYTIGNFKVNKSSLNNEATASMLGVVKKDAVIDDITFENVTVSFSVRTSAAVTLYLIAESVEEGAAINGFSVDAKMTVSMSSTSSLNNFRYNQSDNSYQSNNWLCGGFDSDEEFLTEIEGITLSENASFEITN